MSDVALLRTKMRLLRFDGEVLEIFSTSESDRYHASLISKMELDEKKKRIQFDYGPFAPRPVLLGFDTDELPAVAEFMRAVVTAGAS